MAETTDRSKREPTFSGVGRGGLRSREKGWLGVGILLVAVLIPTILDLVSNRVSSFFSEHQFFTAIVTEALLLIVIYLVIERVIERVLEARLDKRWKEVATPSLSEIRNAGAELWRSIEKSIGDLPERHAPELDVDEAQEVIGRHVDKFERVLARHRPLLTATPTLASYLVAAEALRVDSHKFVEDLKYARGGHRTGEWYEESVRAIHHTDQLFERSYTEFSVTSEPNVVQRLHFRG